MGGSGAELMRSEDLQEGRLRSFDYKSSHLNNVTSGTRTYPEGLLVVRAGSFAQVKLHSFLLAHLAGGGRV